jgi:replicative DNA helicase
MGQSVDQLLFRRVLSELGAPWHIEELGIRKHHLDESSRDAWDWVEAYMKENNGELPGDELLVFEMGWSEESLAEQPKATIKYLSHVIKRREVQFSLEGIIDEVEGLLQRGSESIFEAQAALIEKVDDLRSMGLSRIHAVNVFDLYPQVALNYQKYVEGDLGIETPWPTMTDSIMGFQPGHVVFFVARPQTGKTWALLKTCLNCYDQGCRVLLVTPELTEDECAERLACMQAKVSYTQFTRGRLDPFGKERLEKHIEECREMKGFWVTDSTMSFDKDEVTALIGQFDPDVIAVDSIYCFGDGRNRNEKIAAASPWLVELARKHGRPRLILATSQMNRKSISAETTTIENIYGSDAIAQDAHVIYGMYASEEMYEDRKVGMKQLKVRRGVRHDPFYCNWDLDVMDFAEAPGTTAYSREEDDDEPGY